MLIADVVRLGGRPVQVCSRLAADPRKLARLLRISQTDPEVTINASIAGKIIENPPILGCVVDRRQMPTDTDGVRLRNRPYGLHGEIIIVSIGRIVNRPSKELRGGGQRGDGKECGDE